MSKKPISPAELEKLIELISEAYEKAGKEIKHAVKVTGIDKETGEVEGETVIDKRKKDELN